MENTLIFVNYHKECQSLTERYPHHRLVFASFKNLGVPVLTLSRNIDRAIEELRLAYDRYPYSFIVNFKEQYVVLAARLRRELGLPPTIVEPHVCRDKYLMRQRLERSLPVPEYQLIRNKEDARNVTIRPPLVMKPRYGTNSMNVVKLENSNNIPSEYVRQRRLFARQTLYYLENFDFIAESYVGGTEHTVDAFVVDSCIRFATISDKLPMVAPYFVETGDIMPSRLDPFLQRSALRTVEMAHKELEIQNGWTHTEIKLDRKRVFIIEIAARQGGGYTPQMINSVYGFDPLDVTFRYFVDGDRELSCLSTEPRSVVVMRRFNHFGFNLVVRPAKGGAMIPESRDAAGICCLKPPPSRRVSILVGPPFNHYNTHAAYLASGCNSDDLVRDLTGISAQMNLRILQVPRFLERLLSKLLEVLMQIRISFFGILGRRD